MDSIGHCVNDCISYIQNVCAYDQVNEKADYDCTAACVQIDPKSPMSGTQIGVNVLRWSSCEKYFVPEREKITVPAKHEMSDLNAIAVMAALIVIGVTVAMLAPEALVLGAIL